MNRIAESVWRLAAPVAEELGYELWDVEYIKEAGQWFLRVYIDKANGVGIEDCERFSRALDEILDEADPIPDSYVFEVSSAGAERELKRPSDFERFMGSNVEVRHFQNIDGSKSHLGTLIKYDEGSVTIDISGQPHVFEKTQIAQVRLRIAL